MNHQLPTQMQPVLWASHALSRRDLAAWRRPRVPATSQPADAMGRQPVPGWWDGASDWMGDGVLQGPIESDWEQQGNGERDKRKILSHQHWWTTHHQHPSTQQAAPGPWTCLRPHARPDDIWLPSSSAYLQLAWMWMYLPAEEQMLR